MGQFSKSRMQESKLNPKEGITEQLLIIRVNIKVKLKKIPKIWKKCLKSELEIYSKNSKQSREYDKYVKKKKRSERNVNCCNRMK